MSKEQFYIYQEDLIQFSFREEYLSITEMVVRLNEKFCKEGMKKLRTETITNHLQKKGFLFLDSDGRKRPSQKGKLLGIAVKQKEGKDYFVNQYNRRAQKYILNQLPFIM